MKRNLQDLLVSLFVFCVGCFGIDNEANQTCPVGRYGFKCQYLCSNFCKSGECNIPVSTGVPECYDGCKDHHTGVFCQELCPSLCLECNQTDVICLTCVSGYFGVKCERRCELNCMNGTCGSDGSCKLTADVAEKRIKREISNSETKCRLPEKNGDCSCCKTPYRGNNCETSCENCVTFYIPNIDCRYQCETGFFGDDCQRFCPKTCAPGNSGKPLCGPNGNGEMKCLNGCVPGLTGLQCESICTGTCKDGTCHQKDGGCINCNDGNFGDLCTQNCSKGCEGGKCYRDGNCMNGCLKGVYGRACSETCSKGCKDEACHKNNGTCVYGCEKGFYGTMCDKECGKYCNNSKCELLISDRATTFLCTEGCDNGFTGRQCTEKCPKNCAVCKQLSKGNNCQRCVDRYTLQKDVGSQLVCLPSTVNAQCQTGHYGKACIPCGKHCKSGICLYNTDFGFSCTEGCIDGYTRADCKLICPKNCKICHQNGSCLTCEEDCVRVRHHRENMMHCVAPGMMPPDIIVISTTVLIFVFFPVFFLVRCLVRRKDKTTQEMHETK